MWLSRAGFASSGETQRARRTCKNSGAAGAGRVVSGRTFGSISDQYGCDLSGLLGSFLIGVLALRSLFGSLRTVRRDHNFRGFHRAGGGAAREKTTGRRKSRGAFHAAAPGPLATRSQTVCSYCISVRVPVLVLVHTRHLFP
jgi:hypothetical protein